MKNCHQVGKSTMIQAYKVGKSTPEKRRKPRYRLEYNMPFKYEVIEHIATLSETDNGYSIELNRVEFRGYEPKLDLRRWRHTDEGDIICKGVSLTDDEARALRDVLNKLDL